MGAMELRGDLVFFYAKRQDLVRKRFRIVFRAIAEKFHIRVVPSAAEIFGNAVNDHKVVIRVVDATVHKLHHVAVTDPNKQLARVHRPVKPAESPYAKTSNAQTVLIGIEAAQGLTEHF